MRALSDDDLLRRLTDTVRQSRRVEADLVALIAEVDARRLYAREATPSMFAYCTEVLHFSEPEAVLRIRVARASRQHPVLLTELREGRLHLSGIALLAPLLTRRNRDSLLRRARHRSKEQIRELVAELQPRPDVPSRMRKLPTLRGTVPSASPDLLCLDTVAVSNFMIANAIGGQPGTVDHSSDLAAVAGDPGLLAQAGSSRHPEVSGPTTASSVSARAEGEDSPPDAALRDPQGCRRAGAGSEIPAPAGFASPARSSTVEPLSPARYKVQFTASAELREKLQRLQALMRSSVPDGDLGAVIDAAVTEKLARLEARRFGKTASPRKAVADTKTAPTSRHVPAPIRRAVHERDGGRCTYEDARGRRCTARHNLEFHHHGRPFGRGGAHSVANVRLMCLSHNQLLAERDYGRETMARFRRAEGRDAGARASQGARRGPAAGAGRPGAGGKPDTGRTATDRYDIIAITGGSTWPSSS